jgi:hypothetical protein
MAKNSSAPNTDFRPSGPVLEASFEQIKLAFRAPLNRRRSLKENPEKVLERLLDERVSIDGKTKSKREMIVGNLLKLAGSGDFAAGTLLEKFLDYQRELRADERMATYSVNDEVLQHVAENSRGK